MSWITRFRTHRSAKAASVAPVQKVTALGLGGAFAILVVWILSEFVGVKVVPEVASALPTVSSNKTEVIASARLTKITLKCVKGTGERVEVRVFNKTIIGPKVMATGQQDERVVNVSFNPEAQVTLVISKAGLPSLSLPMNVEESPSIQSRNFQMLSAKYTITARVN